MKTGYEINARAQHERTPDFAKNSAFLGDGGVGGPLEPISLVAYGARMQAMPDIASITDQHAFNLERWKEVCADPALAGSPNRIETDKFGHTLMSPRRKTRHETVRRSRSEGKAEPDLGFPPTRLHPRGASATSL